MSTANRCEFLLANGKPCGEESTWMTDDCKDVHYLCGKHCGQALIDVGADFTAERIEPAQASL